ncbi:Oral-facial-digital syndrome 1 protein [Acipenser ruthenus]|uniref:Oral-facial-digital syndrome 1 protein n=1 Tax=Acipenser ruthenus TaxID=7906 RepID=A0A444U1A0_ACIRT|nr:Oral-facial-digital syndrome 1 protein [Acipenser ruthenus]
MSSSSPSAHGPAGIPGLGLTVSQDSGTELVADAKARIKELEKEAESLEEAYRNYQHRAIKAAISSSQPAKPRSPPETLSIPSRSPSASHNRVTFVDEMLPSQGLHLMALRSTLYDALNLNGAGMQGQETPSVQNSLPPRRLSSTPLSLSDRQESRRLLEDHSDIPEQLEDDVSHQSEDRMNRLSVTISEPIAATSQQDHTIDQKMTEGGERQKREDKEKDEARKWERERKNREEKRLQERQAAWEREQRELERLEQERFVENAQHHEDKKGETEVGKTESKMSEAEDNSSGNNADPLEKYLKIVKQHKEPELGQFVENAQHHEDKKGETEVGKTESKMSEAEDNSSGNNADPLEKYLKIVKQHKEPELGQFVVE